MIEKTIAQKNIEIAKMIGCKIYPKYNSHLLVDTYYEIIPPDWFIKKSYCHPILNEYQLLFDKNYTWFILAIQFFFKHIEEEKKYNRLAITFSVLTPLASKWKSHYNKFLSGDLNGLFEEFIFFAEWYNKNHEKK